MRLVARLRARALILFRENLAGPGVHAAIVVGDPDPVEAFPDAALDALRTEFLHQPFQEVQGAHVALVDRIAGLARQVLHRLHRFGRGCALVLGLLEVVVTTVARRHHGVIAHSLRGNRHVACGHVGLQHGMDVLHFHRPAAIPVGEVFHLEVERLDQRPRRAVVGPARTFERAPGVISNFCHFGSVKREM